MSPDPPVTAAPRPPEWARALVVLAVVGQAFLTLVMLFFFSAALLALDAGHDLRAIALALLALTAAVVAR